MRTYYCEQTPLVLKDGVSQSIRIIGEPKNNKLMVRIVPTKAAFYKDESLQNVSECSVGTGIETIYRGSNLKIANDAVKGLFPSMSFFFIIIFCLGLYVRTMENNRLFVVYRLTSEPAHA